MGEYEELNFMGCLKLIEKCVEEGVLLLDPNRKDNVLIYMSKSEKYDEGWFSVNAHEVAQELMNDIEGQRELRTALKEKNAEFIPDSRYIKRATQERREHGYCDCISLVARGVRSGALSLEEKDALALAGDVVKEEGYDWLNEYISAHSACAVKPAPKKVRKEFSERE